MDKDVIATGKTVDEAIEAACAKMGAPREYVDIEILELPKKKFLGLKTVPAKVKVTLQEEYENKFASPEKKPAAKKPKEKKPSQPKAEKAAPQPEQNKEKKEKTEKPKQKKEPKKEVKEKAPVSEKAEEQKEEAKPLAPEVLELKGSAAAGYIKEILVALGHEDTEVSYSQKDGMIVLQLSGEDMGSVVGRRGDNLDAMQYLASLVANRSEGSYVRVVLDIDDYRSKREASLRAYARKTATQAVRNQRSITLEAMNPYERRIVHSTVQTVSGATSKSIGSEPNRRVVISPVEGGRPPRDGKKFHGEGRGERKGGRGGRPPRRESQKVIVPESNEPPKNDTSAISLYGRIDLD